MLKTLNNVEIEGSFLNLIKNSYKKEKKKVKSFPQEPDTRKGCTFS